MKVSKKVKPTMKMVISIVYRTNQSKDLQIDFGDSTLKRIRTKTKSFIRQLSRHYTNASSKSHNELENKTEDAPQSGTFRSGLKRRLSSVAIRNHGSVSKWRRSVKVSEQDKSQDQVDPHTILSQSNNSKMNIDVQSKKQKNTESHKNNSLSELFQSPDFATRLSLGSVNGRKPYEEYNNNNAGNENDYHVSYRGSNDTNKHNQNEFSRLGDGQFFSLQEKFTTFKDQTIRRSQSIARFFTQEV